MLTVSLIYVALGGGILLALTVSVIARRRAQRIGLGDGGDAVLLRRTRAHGNACETLPIGLLMLVSLELSGGQPLLLHALGTTLLLGRLLHAWGLLGSGGVSVGRFYGMLLTMLAFLGLIGALLWRFVVNL